ncbi:SDR family oxidoreductase [Pseudomonas sp. URMO17WK12:I12]|jgi:short-subunit dehydrogenase|uniref:SDR family NAD(P)-dependent oxidoreductase n=1 Tax=unclassified Pseudomonas TaxID=196821 RepID=UPI000484E1C5|nr:SDR family NAD(P)-dependent oxidoreductase [Pseudomonas sp. URMO17WK12:I12]
MTHKGTAVITGAGTAIGTAFAHRLTQRGYDLILIAVDRPQLMTLAAALTDSSGRSVEVLNADLAVSAEVVRIEALLSQDASITLLINHHDIPEEDEIGATIALGITAPVRLSYALANGFVKRGAGTVINLVPVFETSSGAAIESASSAFLLSLSHALRQRFNKVAVRVQAILYAGSQQTRYQSAVAIVDAALEDFDSGEAISLPSVADREVWNTFEVARLELLSRVAGGPNIVSPARLLH